LSTIRDMATPEQINELTTKMAAQRAELLELARSLEEPDAEVRDPEADGEAGWSAKEQLAHLAQMETTYRAWVKRALVEDSPDVSQGTTSDPVAIPLTEAHQHAVAEHVDELVRQRARTLELIATIDPEQYERTASTPVFGELTVMQWLRSYYRHDRMHAAQIKGEPSDYAPRYAGGVEPDQRLRS
jgi:hypothetical protein